MSSRLRKAYVAAKFYDVVHCCARARHSEATAACSSAFCFDGRFVAEVLTDERELIPTGALMQRPSDLVARHFLTFH